MKRGDVVLVRFPHPSGQRGKKRPAVVVQSDAYAGILSTVVVAEVTKKLPMKDDPACLFIDVSTPEGQAAGLRVDSVGSGALLRLQGSFGSVATRPGSSGQCPAERSISGAPAW